MEDRMSVKKTAGSNVEVPAVEIIVRSGDAELAVIAFFADGNDGWDVLVGIADPTSRNNLKSTLRYAAEALDNSTFHKPGTKRTAGEDNTPPF